MNAKDFEEIVTARMDWCMKTLCAKGDEYARDGDRLWNFKVAARKLNCHPAEALAGMMVKHTVSVDDIIDGLAKGIVPPKELVAEKIGDSIDYLLLLEGLIEEERGRREVVPELNARFMEASEEESYSDTIPTMIIDSFALENGYIVPSGQDGDDRPMCPEDAL